MAAGVTVKHKRKLGAFVNGELAAGEMGLDVTNNAWYYSANGATVALLVPGGVAGLKTYRATLIQTDFSATPPTATVLENTTGASMTWTATAGGDYRLTAGSAIFTASKTMIFVGQTNDPAFFCYAKKLSTTVIELQTMTLADGSLTSAQLNETAFQILIYP